MNGISMIQLAKELGLSVSTVSKALGDSHEISASTKKRVLELAKKYKYKPNPFASNLRKKKGKQIAVIIPDIVNNFFALAVDGIESVTMSKHYDTFIYLTHENLEREKAVLEHLESGLISGLIISVCTGREGYAHFQEFYETTKLPIVFFDRVPDLLQFPKVISNNYESSFDATARLIKAGSKRPVLITTTEPMFTSMERRRGYQDALEKHGIVFTDEMIIHCTDDMALNYTILRKIFSQKKRPDGIFASIEKYAITSYEVCKDLKLSIPKDVKVIGMTNLRTAALLNPSLSTLSQPAFDMGKEAAGLLIKMIEKKSYAAANDIIVLPNELTIRDSI
ncbi:MAG: LacI family transcriptional regulator [Chitinophagaceae bacterium]|nr:LacI family transcriptional regulator [Chitinophagaceae bacterium]